MRTGGYVAAYLKALRKYSWAEENNYFRIDITGPRTRLTGAGGTSSVRTTLETISQGRTGKHTETGTLCEISISSSYNEN